MSDEQPAWRSDIPPHQVEKFDKIDRGTRPLVVKTLKDESGDMTELLWVCDLSHMDPQTSAAIRVDLANLSFYSDISDAKDSRGYRRVTDPGGKYFLAALAQACQSVLTMISI